MLRAHRGIIEPGRHALGFADLSILVLQQVSFGPVQNSRRATARAAGESRGMAKRARPFSSGFDADEFNSLVADEISEKADGIAAASHARDQQFRKLAFGGQYLLFGLPPDHLLKIPDHGGIWVRAQ